MQFLPLVLAGLLAMDSAAHAALSRHDLADAGFHLRPGTVLPADATLHGPDRTAALGSFLAGRPALLVFTDYKCQSLCGVVLDQLAETLPAVPLDLGRDYNVIAVALDGAQTQADALAFRDQHTKGSTLHERGRFLTNDASTLARLETSVGLVAPFDAEHRQFAHPAGLVLVDADGRAQRILSPFALDPFDLKLALTETGAAPTSLVGHALLLCYGWNPAAGLYTLRIERVLMLAATATILAIAGLVGFLLWRERRRRLAFSRRDETRMTSFDAILGEAPDGHSVGLVTLATDRLRVGLTDYGARMLSIEAPDRKGHVDHVLLGFDRADMILKAGSFGAVLGRYANRIAGGRFTLDGTPYQLSVNDAPNTLHGGKKAFSKHFWTLADRSATSATFTFVSPDGDEGFPGQLDVQATYTLVDATLRLHLSATTSAPTPVNLSAHPYFNLAGAASLDINDHDLQVFARTYLPTDATQIPTGVIQAVDGTPFDFRMPARIGDRIRAIDPQLMVARGYDHCFVVDGAVGTLRPACRVTHSASGRVLEIDTDMAGLQVYTGNSLNGSLIGHGGSYRMTSGLALEAQAFPDAPNQPAFPSTILRPKATFEGTIAYRFTVE